VGDMLDRGAAFLESQRHQHMTRNVVYRRGPDEKQVQATVGKTEFEQADDSGLIHRTESRDFLVRTAGANENGPSGCPGRGGDGADVGLGSGEGSAAATGGEQTAEAKEGCGGGGGNRNCQAVIVKVRIVITANAPSENHRIVNEASTTWDQ